jgi:hypothetical protein
MYWGQRGGPRAVRILQRVLFVCYCSHFVTVLVRKLWLEDWQPRNSDALISCEQNLSWEANSPSATQEFPDIVRKSTFIAVTDPYPEPDESSSCQLILFH